MPQELTYLKQSASQTAGPYVHIGLAPGAAGFDIYRQELGWDIVGPNAKGERIRVEGRVIDGMGAPIKDLLLEVWQANSEGNYAHPEGGGAVEDGFRGWGRVITDFETGEWGFDTVKPGKTRGRNVGIQAPHLNLWIVARGINIGLNTRMYFADEAEANAKDPVLNVIEWENRRGTLIAERTEKDGKTVYRFDIKLQGEDETVFFDICEDRHMTTPWMICVAITGSLPVKADNPAVPVTVSEQVESTHEAFKAGAAIVHAHARKDDGTLSPDPERFAALKDGIERHCPAMIIQFSTGGRSGSRRADAALGNPVQPVLLND